MAAEIATRSQDGAQVQRGIGGTVKHRVDVRVPGATAPLALWPQADGMKETVIIGMSP